MKDLHVNAAQIISSVQERGFALVRGVIDQARAAQYLAALDAIYAKRDDTNGDVLPNDFAAESGLTLNGLFDNQVLTAAARRMLGPTMPVLSTFMSVGKQKAIPGISLHTDGLIQGTKYLTLTMWAPLHDCGVDAPGLIVVPGSTEQVLRYLRTKFPGKRLPGWSSGAEWNDGAFDLDALRAEFGEPLFPVMAPGDVMVFTNWTIHGSNVRPGMEKRRSAAILRLRPAPRFFKLRAWLYRVRQRHL